MRRSVKIFTFLIVLVLLLSSFIILSDIELKSVENVNNNKNNDNPKNDEEKNNTDEPNNNDDNTPKDIDYSHTVFIEEGTGTWCEYCPFVSEILYEIYKSKNQNFYYISMIEDKVELANKRLYDDYNIRGFPTVFIDGGYKVLSGGGNEKSEYIDAINAAESRNTPQLRINVSSEYDENTTILSTKIIIKSNETKEYDGRLRVYLTEIQSRWKNEFDDGTRPYHYSFIDYIINKNVKIQGNKNLTLSDERKITEFSTSDLDPEELMIFAVIFNSESIKSDSFPDSQKYGEFNAHYADAADAAKILPGGNLPPTVGISAPITGRIHLWGKEIFKTLRKNTILIGRSKITVNTDDEDGIEKVEFYIDDNLKITDYNPPYEYSFNKVNLFKRCLGKHNLKVIAYDNKGKTDTATMDVITIFL